MKPKLISAITAKHIDQYAASSSSEIRKNQAAHHVSFEFGCNIRGRFPLSTLDNETLNSGEAK